MGMWVNRLRELAIRRTDYFLVGLAHRLGLHNLHVATGSDETQLVIDRHAGASFTYPDVDLDPN